MTDLMKIKNYKISINHWQLFFYVISGVILAQTLLGELFYKSNIYGLYLTELNIILMWSVCLCIIVLKGKVPHIPIAFFLFIFLSFSYLLYSFTQNRPLIWVLRQGVFIVYLSVAVVGYMYVKQLDYKCKWDIIFPVCGIIGVYTLVIYKIFSAFRGNGAFTALLLFLIGSSYWILKQKNISIMIIVGLLCALFTHFISKHTAWSMAGLIVLLGALFVRYRKIRVVLLSASMISLIAGFLLLENLSAVNAVWRYLSRKGIIKESWNYGHFLLGTV